MSASSLKPRRPPRRGFNSREMSAVANSPKECRRQALACVQLALDSALPKDKETFARLATRWISLANDLELS